MSKIQNLVGNTSTRSLFKEPHSNPIEKFLELIPYSESVLDPLKLDELRLVMMGCGYEALYVSNSLVIMLLNDLHKAGLVELKEITWPNTLGSLVIMKRNLHGE